jgi:methionine aminotransferase
MVGHAERLRQPPLMTARAPTDQLQTGLHLQSRLPRVGTTIFTVMSALASEHDAVNLGQGFPDFACDPSLVDAVTAAMQAGLNQYPPMTGIPALREGVARKIAALYGRSYDADREVTITAGATQAILTAVLALVRPGDDVLVIEPVYDSYVPAILLAGGRPVAVKMRPPGAGSARFGIDWDDVTRAVTPATRVIMVNSPHNPTGFVFSADDLVRLEALALRFNLLVISDEVYEHMVFDGALHESIARRPALAERSVLISSFGKTYHVTGWKIAYVAAPAEITAEFRKVHQFNVFTVNTPMQHALAAYMADPNPYLQLAAFYQVKRDLFLAGLGATPLRAAASPGTYFQIASYEQVGGVAGSLTEAEFCKWLTREIGVAAIPVSAFYDAPIESRLIRFCFAKTEATLGRALERLEHL